MKRPRTEAIESGVIFFKNSYSIVQVQYVLIALLEHFLCLDEPDAIKLSVYTKEKKQVSEMYICSVGADFLLDNICESANMICPGTEETIVNRFTVHPLLLCRGNIGPRKTFFEWLKV